MGNPIEQSDKGQGALQASDAKTRYDIAKTATPTSKCLIAAPYFPCLLDECDVKVRVQEPGRNVLVG